MNWARRSPARMYHLRLSHEERASQVRRLVGVRGPDQGGQRTLLPRSERALASGERRVAAPGCSPNKNRRRSSTIRRAQSHRPRSREPRSSNCLGHWAGRWTDSFMLRPSKPRLLRCEPVRLPDSIARRRCEQGLSHIAASARSATISQPNHEGGAEHPLGRSSVGRAPPCRTPFLPLGQTALKRTSRKPQRDTTKRNSRTCVLMTNEQG